MFLTLASFIVVLGVIIFVHELGHFIAAKLVGIRVDTFSLGFPPKLFSKKIGETEYVLAWIPLGGYVKMAGMVDESMGDEPLTGAPWEFMSKSFPQKAFVITAGVIMNFLLGFLVYFFLTMQVGSPVASDEPLVGYAVEGHPAAAAGIEIGDRIVAIDGDSILTWQNLVDAIHPKAGEDVEVTWLHADSVCTAIMQPMPAEYADGDSIVKYGRIGINPKVNFEEVGILESAKHGNNLTIFIISESLKMVKQLIFGETSMDGLAGPIGIAQISGQTIRSGFIEYLSLIAQVSISIGLLNIMPFPVLDGSHLIFVTIEAITRRTIPTAFKLNIQKAGLALLLVFFLVVSYNDIMRIITGP